MPLSKLEARSPMVAQAARFAIVGVANTLVDLSFFTLFFFLLTWPLLIANAVSFVIAAVCGYFLNKIWTFSDRSGGGEAMRRGFAFLAVATGGLAIASLIIWLAAMVLSPIMAKLAAIGGTFLWNFTVTRRWVFRAD